MNNIKNIIEEAILTGMAAEAELPELMASQADDLLGFSKHNEYLGGNGQTMWHHCQPRDDSTKGHSGDTDADHKERKELELVVASHQGSIEDNGYFNVRSLSRWSGGKYDGDKAQKASLKRHRDLLGIKGPVRASSTKDGRATKSDLAARKAKRLARLAARRG